MCRFWGGAAKPVGAHYSFGNTEVQYHKDNTAHEKNKLWRDS